MYPYPPNNQQGNLGFSDPSQRPGEGPGYPLMQGGGFPVPPNPAYPQVSNAYPSYSPGACAPNPQQSFPTASSVNDYGASAFGRAPFPADSSSMYTQSQNSSFSNPNFPPYNPNPSSAMPYSQPAGPAVPYPPSVGGSYPSAGSPYPSTGSSPYPSSTGSYPYPPSIGSSPYPPTGSSPYNPGAAPYPPNSGAMPFQSNVPPAGPLPPQPMYQPTGPQGYAPKSSMSSYSSFSAAPSHQSPQSHGTAGVMWPYQERATIRPALSFDPSSDAAALRKAMKGFGTDEKAIVAVLGRRTAQQRQQILIKYQQAYGKDLIRDLKSELSGRFEYAILALMSSLPDFLAQELHNAIRGVGTNERTLIEIICSSDNQTIRAIKAVYASKYNRPLENDLRSDLSGDVQHLLIAVSTGCRDEFNYDTSIASQLAQALYNAGVKKKFGTNESEFIRILSCYSYPVLRAVFSEYHKITGKSLENAINSETSGYFRVGLLALYAVANNRAAYFAGELREAMSGLGTKDNHLVRIIVSRSEIDMGNIKDEYLKMYGKRLEDAVASDTSGDYKSLLLTLIQG